MKKIAFVTGANRGLGLGCALELARDHLVVFGVRKVAEFQKRFQEIKQEYPDIDLMPFDAEKPESISAAIDAIKQKYKRLDILINNAGVYLDSREAAALVKSFEVNTVAPYLAIQKVLPLMLEQNFGRIVNVSSGMGQLKDMEANYPAYRISKTALNAVTRIYSKETQGKNVLINAVCPGWVKTDMGGPNAHRSIPEGVKSILWAARIPDGGPTGGYFRDGVALDW